MNRNNTFDSGGKIHRRGFLKMATILGVSTFAGYPFNLFAQAKKRIAIATGGMGGVYFVMGRGIASILTKYAGTEAAAEVTAASVDNCKLVAARKADFGFTITDTAYDAFKGTGVFQGKALPIRTVTALYPGNIHIITTEEKGIKKVEDLKGKCVSTGAPCSGTEVNAFRVLEAAGINHEKDIRKYRLGASESVNALKNRTIDAYFWTGGVPTSSVQDLASSPGIKMVIIPNDYLASKITARYGPIYHRSVIKKHTYTGLNVDVPVMAAGNNLIVHKDTDDMLVYRVVKTIFANLREMEAVHKEVLNISLKNGASEKGVPYHRAAQKFFRENKFIVRA